MWILRDIDLQTLSQAALPLKVLRGPRQVGKTSLLARLGSHQVVFLDDAVTRLRANENPRFFLEQLPPKLVLDEAPLAPALFPELKRRVDEARLSGRSNAVDIWITGSNQTLMHREVAESLSGRASYFDLNTLSIHELQERWSLSSHLLKGGWPELYTSPHLDATRYLNDLISTYIEGDIVAVAGIERRLAFLKVLHLLAGRIGQLFVASDLATAVGVDATTVQSWISLLVTNGIVLHLPAYYSNLNKRLTKSPKYFFADVALASRLQGWQSAEPILNTPLFGHLFENMVVGEVARFFMNRGLPPTLSFVRSKEKIEIDLLVHLSDQRHIALEVKTTPTPLSQKQHDLLDSLNLNIIARWVVAPDRAMSFEKCEVVAIQDLWSRLTAVA